MYIGQIFQQGSGLPLQHSHLLYYVMHNVWVSTWKIVFAVTLVYLHNGVFADFETTPGALYQ